MLEVLSFPVCLIIHVCTPTMHTYHAHLPCQAHYHTHPSPFSYHTHLYYPSDTFKHTPNPVEHKHIQLFIQHKHISLLYYMSYNTPTHYHHLSPHPRRLCTHPVHPHILTCKTQLTYTAGPTTPQGVIPCHHCHHHTQSNPHRSPHPFSIPASMFELLKCVYMTYVQVKGPCVACPDHSSWANRH